ncbi:MAG: hypothetical protein ABIS26_00860 [Candidatus Paceibacterota bacterium]
MEILKQKIVNLKWRFIFVLINLIFLLLMRWIILMVNACSDDYPYMSLKICLAISILILLIGIKWDKHIKKITWSLLVLSILVFLFCTMAQASLNSARCKGTDAVIKADMRGSQELISKKYFDKNQTFLGICTQKDGILSGIKHAAQMLSKNNLPTSGTFSYSRNGDLNSVVCHESSNSWAAISSLKNPSVPSAGWCVDSKGFSNVAISLAENETSCPQ